MAASVQTMINIIEDDEPDRSGATSGGSTSMAAASTPVTPSTGGSWPMTRPSKKGLHGLGLFDWADMLNTNGHGPYEIDRAPTRKQAIRMAARAIRMTGQARSGWWSGGGPRLGHVRVQRHGGPRLQQRLQGHAGLRPDPWYPSVSSIWGASRPPNAAVAVSSLARGLPARTTDRAASIPSVTVSYMLILPTLPSGTPVE